MSASKVSSSAEPSAHSRRRWLTLGFLALAQFLVVLDASIVNIALPVIGSELHMDSARLAWVITAYVLPFGGFLLLGGRLADRFGHRRLFLTGTLGFVLASALAGFSVSSGMLIIARALQGASAALLAPAALALLTQLFTLPSERARALGVWGGVAGIGSAAGVLLGGILTASFGWSSVFFVNVPIGVVVIVAVLFLLTADTAVESNRLDLPGAATITGALIAAVSALSAWEQVGPGHPLTLILAAATGALILGSIIVERRAAQPLIPLRVFRNRSLTVGNIVMLLLGAAMIALFFALSVYMQSVLGYSALTAGLTQLPLAAALIAIAGAAPAAITRFGSRSTLIAFLLTLASGLTWLAFAPSEAAFVSQILGPTLLIGVGMGGAFVTTTQLAVEGVPGGEAGLAGGLVNTSQQIGGALGLAVLSTVAATRTSALVDRGVGQPEALTSGFSLLFIGAAIFALGGVVAASFAHSHSAGSES